MFVSSSGSAAWFSDMVEVALYWLSQRPLDQGLAPFYGGKNRGSRSPTRELSRHLEFIRYKHEFLGLHECYSTPLDSLNLCSGLKITVSYITRRVQ